MLVVPGANNYQGIALLIANISNSNEYELIQFRLREIQLAHIAMRISFAILL